MNERLTIQNLIDLLASKHGMSKKDAEAFVKEFFLLIEQALENESYVKIKGLGTFKLIDVDSRESVSVNTGERFRIQGHTKVSFTPDNSLKDTINKPFAHFETVVLNEKTLLEDTQSEDTDEEDILEEDVLEIDMVNKDELSQDIVSEIVPEASETVSDPTQPEDKEEIKEVVHPPKEDFTIDQEKKLSSLQSAPQATAEEIIAKELEKVTSPKDSLVVDSSTRGKKPENTSKEKTSSLYLLIIIAITLLLCGGAVLFIYYPDLFSFSADKNKIEMPLTNPIQEEPLLIDTLENDQDTIVETAPDPEIPEKTITPSASKEKQEVSATPRTETKTIYQDSATYTITGTKATHTIKVGETLTKVSLHFYGTKALWPYIVKHNPGVIKNPDNVPYGTIIKIPELSK